jgi:hypothetical protein
MYSFCEYFIAHKLSDAFESVQFSEMYFFFSVEDLTKKGNFHSVMVPASDHSDQESFFGAYTF